MAPREKPLVGIVMGSDSDLPVMEEAAKALDDFNIPHEVIVSSAHRTPDLTARYARGAERRGLKVIIAGAGGAAHLAGVIAAHTTLPVIGVPVNSGPLNGLDALLSTVQMPGGIPVATVAIGKAGAKNAGILAAEILAIADEALDKKLKDFRKSLSKSVREKDKKVRRERTGQS
ncbi:MAG: 5-(carboxyamino)imidazole ribonucleotide mutase [Thermodesulfobacteriota bacterium]|nr:MAG: 5-(carboxyamino)imidazole ribonucleotide mutase [Thermodesulfobacteriota bacterium]